MHLREVADEVFARDSVRAACLRFCLMEKGRACFFGKDYRAAQSAFAAFVDAFPGDPQGHLWYGLSAWRLNDKEFGLKKLREAGALNPADETIKQALQLAQKGETLHFEREAQDEMAAAGKPEAAKKPLVIEPQDE